MSVVEAVMLTRNYGEFRAVAGVNFSIKAGECYGFLGPNGAGKTTTIKMIHGFLPKSGGSLMALGRDIEIQPEIVKASIGVVHQENNLDKDLTVLQNLITYARYFDIPKGEALKRALELLKFLQLEGKAGEKLSNLSGGMQRRLAIARALINNPRLLILDEPTTGLDPQARHLIWHRVQTLKKQGITIVLTTHYMEEAERLCDRVAIMDAGMILMEGSPAELTKREIGTDVIEVTVEPNDMDKFLYGMERIGVKHERHGNVVFIYPEDIQNTLKAVIELDHLSALQRRATLEDLFLKLAGRSLKE